MPRQRDQHAGGSDLPCVAGRTQRTRYEKICEHYWINAFRYYAYKRWTGRPVWKATFAFERARRQLRPGDCVIDAGANVGRFTGVLAKTGATVHAFEPDPWAAQMLRATFDSVPNVIIHEAAIGDNEYHVSLYRTPQFEADPELKSQSSSLFADKTNVSRSSALRVRQIDFVAFVRALNRPIKILKLDVEGAEVPILEALIRTGLVNNIRFIFAETHEKRIPQLAERTHALKTMVARQYRRKINLDWD